MKKLSAHKREANKKSIAKSVRYAKDIPAVLYGPKVESQTIVLSGKEVKAILESTKKGHLSVQKYQLSLEGKEYPVLFKEIQYHPTTYAILHVDLQVLDEETKISAKVPIELLHEAECQGVKLGGILRQVIRHLRVECFPKDLPQVFEIDVKDLHIGQSRKLKDLTLPEAVRPLMGLNEVVTVVTKR